MHFRYFIHSSIPDTVLDVYKRQDKTISKWENGNSIPDTSILNELCATLDINVNELLSGEKLTPEIYSIKAEENMMNLLEDNQKQQCFTLFPLSLIHI